MGKLFNRDIIEADLRANGESTAAEIAERTELPFSSVASTLRSMKHRRIVQVVGKILVDGPGKSRVYRLRTATRSI